MAVTHKKAIKNQLKEYKDFVKTTWKVLRTPPEEKDPKSYRDQLSIESSKLLWADTDNLEILTVEDQKKIDVVKDMLKDNPMLLVTAVATLVPVGKEERLSKRQVQTVDRIIEKKKEMTVLVEELRDSLKRQFEVMYEETSTNSSQDHRANDNRDRDSLALEAQKVIKPGAQQRALYSNLLANNRYFAYSVLSYAHHFGTVKTKPDEGTEELLLISKLLETKQFNLVGMTDFYNEHVDPANAKQVKPERFSTIKQIFRKLFGIPVKPTNGLLSQVKDKIDALDNGVSNQRVPFTNRSPIAGSGSATMTRNYADVVSQIGSSDVGGSFTPRNLSLPDTPQPTVLPPTPIDITSRMFSPRDAVQSSGGIVPQKLSFE